MEPCVQTKWLETLEKELTELKQNIKEHSGDISMLKESASETKVYVKQIFERLDDIKLLFNNTFSNLQQMFNNLSKDNLGTVKSLSADWVKITIELIKQIGVIAGIIAAIKLVM